MTDFIYSYNLPVNKVYVNALCQQYHACPLERGDCLYTLEHFWKCNEYHQVVWLLLLLLDKMVTEKDELRDSNSQRKC